MFGQSDAAGVIDVSVILVSRFEPCSYKSICIKLPVVVMTS